MDEDFMRLTRRNAVLAAIGLFGAGQAIAADQPAPAGASPQTFGRDPAQDYPLTKQPPGEPTFGENHAFWLFDDQGRLYINNHVNSNESFWPLRRETLSVTLSDGRVLVDMDDGSRTTRDTAGGANFTAQCVEPFRRWRLGYSGTLIETTQAALAGGALNSDKRVLVDWDADIVCPVPPTQSGTGSAQGALVSGSRAFRFMGASRYEQLFRAQVRFRIEGEPELTFTATGVRTHRRGARDVGGFAGHDWKSAIFPSGDGFNIHAYRNPDGTGELWSEAFIIKDGAVHPGALVSHTWITSRQTRGEELPIVIKTDLGEVTISGATLGGVFRPMNGSPGNPYGRLWGIHGAVPGEIALCQSWARFTMNGETANGLCERSIFADRIAW